MSHESIEPGRGVVYTLPARPSDSLRSLQFSQFFHQYRGTAFCVRTADGWSWSSSPYHPAAFIATFRTRDELDAVLESATEAKLGRVFLDGDLDIQGDIFALLPVAEYTLRNSEGLSGSLIQTISRITLDLPRRFKPARKTRGLPNWHCAPCPLDLPVEFFAPWLGALLAHSCAIFSRPDLDLASAQSLALERACEILSLGRADRLLDVGCGWGTLLLHATEHFGADVQGLASTELQAEVAADRIARSAFRRSCSVECRDLRTAPWRPETFDKIADIGIFEQVTFADLHAYLGCMQQLLVPGGLLLLHRMTRSRANRPSIRTLHPHLFAEPLSRELDLAESAGLEVIQVESLQREYEQTLRIWIERLRQSGLREMSHPVQRAYRAWLLYLVEAAANLQAGDLQVHRVLLRRPPRTRMALHSRDTN